MAFNEIKTFLIRKSGNSIEQFIRYCLTGGLAFIVDFGILYLLTNVLGFHYLIGATVGFCVGLIITYLGSILWIFDEHRLNDKKAEVSVFILIGVIGLVLTDFFMWIFTDASIAGLNYMISKIITTIIVTLWNFTAKKFILFTKNKTK